MNSRVLGLTVQLPLLSNLIKIALDLLSLSLFCLDTTISSGSNGLQTALATRKSMSYATSLLSETVFQ